MTDQTLILFRRFKAETGDVQAAAMLTLAHALLGEKQSSAPLTVKAAAERLGVSPDVVYSLCNSGQLKHRRVGRSIRIEASDLDAA
ncbi:MAG TPA: helix-turn-helix domain-containing protein [Pirellulales bacterium]|jgi:excisionase family DNA binding protein|nr:helix-turn-helix domain-containing protein [Pirellulales bacterium]